MQKYFTRYLKCKNKLKNNHLTHLSWRRNSTFCIVQHLIYADQNIIICSGSKKKEASELIDGSQRSGDLIHSFIWKLPHCYMVLHLLHLYFCWQARLVLPEHLSCLTRRLIVYRGEGRFMVHTETSGRSPFHDLFGPEIPSLHICEGMFALFDCWGQFTLNPVCTKCKQKLSVLWMFSLYSHISKHNHILVITT